MGSLWRSEDMTLVRMTMQREAAHDVVEGLGTLGKAHFRDLNQGVSAFQRQYANEVKRCDELERKLRYFEEQLDEVSSEELSLSRQRRRNRLEEELRLEQRSEEAESLEDLENIFENYEKELRELNDKFEQLRTEQNSNKELAEVLKQGENFFTLGQDELEGSENSGTADSQPLLEEEFRGGSSALGYLTGVIPTEKQPQFSLLCYRATRANMHLRYSEIDEPLLDPLTGKMVEKSVFIVFFGAERAREKIKKACESLGASIHEYPEGNSTQIRRRLQDNIDDCDNTIRQTDSRRSYLLTSDNEIAGNIDRWEIHVAKEKAIFHTLNLFDHETSQHSVVAESWVPSKNLDDVRRRMGEGDLSSGAQVSSYLEPLNTKQTPPTYFETNFFTRCFQSIVDAYGTSRYKEVNPGVLTLITFPFLFGIMFGDAGHGIILTIFGLVLCILQDWRRFRPSNEILLMLFDGRWVLFLMGLFSIYCGLVYDEWFGFPVQLFHSPIEFKGESSVAHFNRQDGAYIFGVDPHWYDSGNKLQFYNSLKKKLSVLFGVIQMLVGLFLSLLNNIHFRDWADLVFEFIPEVIFLGFTFGYLCFMIIYKWCLPWENGNGPDLLQTMTMFFLSPLPSKEFDIPLYSGQGPIQFLLLLAAVFSLPVLLVGKPSWEIYKFNKHLKTLVNRLNNAASHLDINVNITSSDVSDIRHDLDSLDQRIDSQGGSEQFYGEVLDAKRELSEFLDEESFDKSEIIIKQVIHTIEFALNCVSHTASYLRLWALSLAHSQLSDVFWTMTIGLLMTIEGKDPTGAMKTIGDILNNTGAGVFIGFSIWFAATVAVLLVMESLSAFLHALRLHWVEFESKFFYGDGSPFLPFSFHEVLHADDE
eukprot:gb/GECH01011637.1/.p1 GENE.gb/GECH01011637.1/~~gb/GECH01011637.1/.p1  ORF type:complete len:873 (+),score=186.84 gb/GECH01011637.1/:1-2619(+)